MNPIYRFQLSAGNDTRQAFPVYGPDLAIDYALEQNEEFYRGKLSGKLTFQSDDYEFIRNKAFDTQFDIVISISYNGGQTWAVYWSGQFWKTDCEFDEDSKTATVTPNVNDQYNAVLAGMDKEYNLIDLVPEIVPVKLDKRPMIQIYVPGQTTIGCFLSGMWWEQQCEAVGVDETIIVDDEPVNKLVDYCHFALCKSYRVVELSGVGLGDIPFAYYGNVPELGNSYTLQNGGYRFNYTISSMPGGYREEFDIQRISDGAIMWSFVEEVNNPVEPPFTITMQPNVGTGTVQANIFDYFVYGRYITDVETVQDVTTFPIPVDDLVPNNRNYSRVIGYQFPETIFLSATFSATPTKWGLYEPGKYYRQPPGIWANNSLFPIARNAWGKTSLWFGFYVFDYIIEQRFRKDYTLRNAYPLGSAISLLLAQIAPGVTHAETSAYSEFLYGTYNPISEITQRLFITPKSNVASLGYDQPAQKAIITLKYITDMLRDCFRCYWFIDEQNRFRIEHISYFMNGGAYPGTPDFPQIGINLTEQIVTRNGKPWSYARNQYKFDKPEMAARYQFGWMDDVTELFDGYPIDIISKFVNPDNIKQIAVSQFTSDVDYILLNPGEISKDGFVLLSGTPVGDSYKLPYVQFEIDNTEIRLQNGYVAFAYLQQYYLYDMPAWDCQINGEDVTVMGVKKLKTQTLNFPVYQEPGLSELFKLIKTEIGNGTIQKMSVNLSSRNANTTLKYDTE